jgi:hypothetical protein
MAGDWIKMRGNLWDDPRVARICDETNKREAEVIGGLYWLWSMADEQSEDGNLIGLSLATIDRKTGIKTFGAALLKVGWILEITDGLKIARFEEHNGSSAKRRAQMAKASSNYRASSSNRHQSTMTELSLGDDLEKRREDISPVVPEDGDVQAELIDRDLSLNRARMLFRMRPSTQLDSSQLRSWKKNKGVVQTTAEEDWLLLEWLYAQGATKGEPGEFRRKDLATLLSNWNGEIQRARAEASNRGADFLKKEKRGCQPEPDGWKSVLCELYDDSDPEAIESATWEGLPPAVRSQILTRIQEAIVVS